MPEFVCYDPEEFVGAEHVVFHEGGHILTAYRYGFILRAFSFRQIHGELAGGFGCEVNASMARDKPGLTPLLKASQLLAGEVAARRRFGLTPDQVVFPMAGMQTIHAGLSLNTVRGLIASNARKHDVAKVLDIARTLGIVDWWTWFWKCHAVTVDLINNQNDQLERLAHRLSSAKPFDGSLEAMLGNASNLARRLPFLRNVFDERGSGQIHGPEILKICRNLNLDVGDPNYPPSA